MFGMVIGTLSLFGLIHMLRKGRRCGARGFHGHHHRHGRGGGPGFLWQLFERLDTSPGQEKEIRAAFRDLREEAWGLRGQWGATRAAAVDAFGEDLFDEGPLDALFVEQDQKIAEVREALKKALGRVHEALDDEQRSELASWLKRWGKGRGGRRGWGPYR